MEGKKRYIAIVLFLLIGLTVFTFANPVEEEKGSKSNNSKDSEVTNKKEEATDGTLGFLEDQNLTQVRNQVTDTSYADALAAVVRAEGSLAELDVETARDLINQVTNQTQRDDLTERLDIVEETIDAIKLVEELEKMVEEAEERDDIKDSIDYRTDNEIIQQVDALRNEDVQKSLQERLQILSRILDDNIPPTYEGVKDNEITKENVLLTYSDIDPTTGIENEVTVKVTLNEEAIEFEKPFTKEGKYLVTLTDEAFNETKVTFTIDKTAPKFIGLKNGSHYEKIKVLVDDETATIVVKNMDTKQSEEVTNGKELETDATYYITATDEAGNMAEIWLAIDTKAPTITGITNGSVVNKSENIYVNDKFLEIVKITGPNSKGEVETKTFTRADFTVGTNNENFSFTYKANYEGIWTVVATDKAGNSYTESFTIDRTAPTATITKSNNDKSTNQDVTVTLKAEEEILTPEGWTVVTEGFEFTKVYSQDGKYEVVITDKAGNKSTIKYEVKRIDKVAPTATVTKSNNDKSTNQDVTVTIVADEAIYKPAGWTEVSTNKEHEFTKVYSENGKYEVEITDKAGNKSTIKFEVKRIDKVDPEGKVTTSNNNGKWSTNQDVVATLVTNEPIYKPEGWTEVSTNKEHEFTKVYSENGKYEVEITDKAGNKSTIKFEVKRIDKVAPVVTVVDSNKYKLEVHSEYVDKGYSAWDAVDKDVTSLVKITYQFQAKGTSTWPFVDELDTSKLGTYKVIYTAYDKAGNSSKGTRVVEIVDTTSPAMTLNGEKNITLEAGIDTYKELGVKVTDNYDETIEALQPVMINFTAPDGTKETWLSEVDTTRVGEYKISYSHEDTSGNVAYDTQDTRHDFIIRIVNVVDTTSPAMTLNGEKNITLGAGIDTYKELGVKVTDNVDETIEALQPVMINFTAPDGTKETWLSEVDTTRVGEYKISYSHKDTSGNVAYDTQDTRHDFIIRIVNVVAVDYEVKFAKTNYSGIYNGTVHNIPTDAKLYVIKNGTESVIDNANITYKSSAEMKNVGTYTITASYNGHQATAEYKIDPLLLKVVFPETLENGDTPATIKANKISFTDQNDNPINNIEINSLKLERFVTFSDCTGPYCTTTREWREVTSVAGNSSHRITVVVNNENYKIDNATNSESKIY